MSNRKDTAETRLVLTVLLSGGRIEARRVFPHGYHLWLAVAGGRRYATEINPTTLDKLVLAEYVLAKPCGKPGPGLFDEIDYTITSAGVEAMSEKERDRALSWKKKADDVARGIA